MAHPDDSFSKNERRLFGSWVQIRRPKRPHKQPDDHESFSGKDNRIDRSETAKIFTRKTRSYNGKDPLRARLAREGMLCGASVIIRMGNDTPCPRSGCS